MSYDFGIWKRSATTKTAMVVDVWDSITEGRAHPAMGTFDADAVLAEIAGRFPGCASEPDGALLGERGNNGDWIIIHAPHSAVEAYTGTLVTIALSHGLMLWDPQRGVVWGNRRPGKQA